MAPPKDQHTQIAEAMLKRLLRVAELLAPYAEEDEPAPQPSPPKSEGDTVETRR